MSLARYIVGIDLGTTNCAVAYVDTRGRERVAPDIRVFEVPQLVGPGEVAARSMLPSFLYLTGGPELPDGAAALPWNPYASQIVGAYARIQGARVPMRLVSSAKSWLCHAGVDREDGILPWGSPAEVRRVSPVEASATYLRHIRDAWNHTMAANDPAAELERQEVVLTVPASFDEAARELTVAAARAAGLNYRLTLLEEPQAAFYCWIVTHEERWQRELRAGALVLVCDIGGGTTDFSLITVVETPQGPGFRRVAVGDHLMLGGDNIDLALAHKVEERLGGVRLDSEQWNALQSACRGAKEALLGENPPPSATVSIAGRGSRIVGGAIQSELTRADVLETAIEGFFPPASWDAQPQRSTRLGLQEFGLPYVADPAITRHLAAFLRRHAAEQAGGAAGAIARPDAILFNGGALTPALLRDRLVSVVSSWSDAGQGPGAPRVLSNTSLDLAVAIGAAYYGIVRRGGGIRIGGGTARSYYVGVEGPAQRPPWLCVVPRDVQEGDSIAIEGHDVELLMGQPVVFPLASSSVRPQDAPGDLVPDDPDSLRALPPLVGTMRVGRKARAERVPVQLSANVTEVGTIELWCRSRTDERRWRLQIQLRGASGTRVGARAGLPGGEGNLVIEQSEVDAGSAAIREAFGLADPGAAMGVSRLVKRLEALLDAPRDRWPPSALRGLWDALRDTAEDRLRSPHHEARWLNLAGYCLRPGAGYPLDESRVKALWPVFHQGLKHTKDAQCWAEWWILWRRVSAGLNRAHQDEIHRRLAPFLTPARGGGVAKKAGRPKPLPHELAEMWRCAASLERLQPSLKEGLLAALLGELKRAATIPAYLPWSVGRLAARVPLFGPANSVVPPATAATWAEALAAAPCVTARETTDVTFALAQIGRVSGDRARDLDDAARGRILARLQALGAGEDVLLPVREYHEIAAAQQEVALGDALPVGLRLVSDGAEARSDEVDA